MKHRLPRKLKKGYKTLIESERPYIRTKWQHEAFRRVYHNLIVKGLISYTRGCSPWLRPGAIAYLKE